MRLPRMTIRRWMVTVAMLSGVMLIGAEGWYSRIQADYHGKQEQFCSWESGKFYGNGKAALAFGHKEEAARLFAKSTYWSEKASGHHRMWQMHQHVWWFFGYF